MWHLSLKGNVTQIRPQLPPYRQASGSRAWGQTEGPILPAPSFTTRSSPEGGESDFYQFLASYIELATPYFNAATQNNAVSVFKCFKKNATFETREDFPSSQRQVQELYLAVITTTSITLEKLLIFDSRSKNSRTFRKLLTNRMKYQCTRSGLKSSKRMCPI